MDHKTLIARSETMQAAGEQYGDLFGGQLEALKRKYGIDSPRHLAETLSALGEADRLLNIGFVGRVKAGKSSLLNALFFDGRSILPKAATPMTAALTTLTHGECFAADVEFFSAEDLQQIRTLANQYRQQFETCLARHKTDILTRFERNGRTIDQEEIRRMAERQARMEMKTFTSLAAADEQVQHMKASSMHAAAPGATTRLAASSPEELVEQLKHYVGANGAYMPFTKIVHVYMPLESLRDIRVIDTPGTNDPVVSREERTITLLKSCDVVFVVSPAGQFLNEDDLNLLNRITLREGVQELALVASQLDSQLHDSEKRARLDDALNRVCESLTGQARRNLGELKRSNPEAAPIFEALLASMPHGVLHSAGICMTLDKELDQPIESWGDEERTAWENLAESYPDYFSAADPEFTRVNLAKLSNISRIRERLAEVRSRKRTITEQKTAALQNDKVKGLEDYRKALGQLAQGQIALVKSVDIGALQTQLSTLHFRQLKLQHELDQTYKTCLHEYHTKLRGELTRSIDKYLKSAIDQVSTANKTETLSERVEKTGWLNALARKLWNGGNEIVEHTLQTVMPGQIYNALEQFIGEMETQLSDTSDTARQTLDLQLHRQLTPAVKRILEDDCNPHLVYRAIVEVLNGLDVSKFALELSPPPELYAKRTLKGDKAQDYIDLANDFIAGLGNRAKNKVRQFLERLEQGLPDKISKSFVDVLAEQIRALENQVNNASQTIDRLERMLRELEGAAL